MPHSIGCLGFPQTPYVTTERQDEPVWCGVEAAMTLREISASVPWVLTAATLPAYGLTFPLLAPAVGNVHGLIKGGNPALNIERIKEIKNASTAPLVLHGASGITDDELHQAIKAGISIVHYNTELRVAYREALVKSLENNKEEVAPYKYLKSAEDAIAEVVEKKLRIMNGL